MVFCVLRDLENEIMLVGYRFASDCEECCLILDESLVEHRHPARALLVRVDYSFATRALESLN